MLLERYKGVDDGDESMLEGTLVVAKFRFRRD